MRVIKFALLVLILVVMGASSLQFSWHLVKEPPLVGYFNLKELPTIKEFTWKKWFSEDFQEELSSRLHDNSGLRNTMIRINNQYDFSLFGLIHAEGFVKGKQRYLYEEDYIHEYTGEYFIGKAVIDKKLARLKNVIDSLKAHNIPLLLVYEPGKASFFPEYIPRRFHPERRTLNNYEYMVSRSQELGIDFMDMNSYFLKMKDTARYPLFPRYGMHWSLYGVPKAVDTLKRSIEKMTGTILPGFKTSRLYHAETPMGTDNDIGEMLNLVCPLNHEPDVYPFIAFDKTPPVTLSALVIADSYYGNIVDDFGPHMFRNQDYWYYNSKLYPYMNCNPPKYVDKSGLREKLTSYNVILLMVSEINLHCGFWNFADEAYMAFHPEKKDPLLYGFENSIRNDRGWFRFMVKKSKIQGRPVEEMVREDAGYTFYSNYNNLPGKTYWDSVYHLAFDIRYNAEWLAKVTKKAHDWKIPVDSVVMLDAIYCYEQSKKKH